MHCRLRAFNKSELTERVNDGYDAFDYFFILKIFV